MLFRAATPFLDVPAGVDIEVAVAVNPSNSVADAIATFPLGSLDDGGTYVVIAAGIVGDATNGFNLYVNPAAQDTAGMMGNVDFTVFHSSPNAPNVDVDARTVGTLISDLAFGEFTDSYLSVPAGNYYLDMRAAGDPNIVATFQADLSSLDGGAALVFASGLFSGVEPAFGVWVALPDGTTFGLDQLVNTGEIARYVSKLDIMPNPIPANFNATVQYALTEALDVTVVISNFQGQIVRTQRLGQQPAGEFSLRLDTTHLAQGIYNYSFVTPKGTMTKRFVVTK